MHLTPHIVVRDLDRAARWYADAFGAVERSRIPLPGGRVMIPACFPLRGRDIMTTPRMISARSPEASWAASAARRSGVM